MNKTVSINLGGFFFHIDEDAFQKLNRYFDAIRRSLSPDGKDEIMGDIESRIAELLSEKLKNDKQVVSIREVDEVITVMGQPEDYRIDEDDKEPQAKTGADYNQAYVKSKKFYRDEENGKISGVSAGLGHYFRVDPLWIRIIFILSLFISFGTSIFIYLLLWILIPKAVTTTEKLEMTGEPINISNIERKVREEIYNVSERFQNVDYDKIGQNVKSGAEKIGNGASVAVLAILKGLAKVIGAIITVFSAIALGCLVIALIAALFSSALAHAQWYPFFTTMNYTNVPLWLLAVIGFFALAIPFFVLFLLGLKILVDNLRPIGQLTKYTLLALWIISLCAAIYLGMVQSSQFSNEGKTFVKQEIPVSKTDTLHIKFRYNEYFTKSLEHNYDFSFKQDSLGHEVIYSNNVSIVVLKTDNATPYVQIEKIAEGASIAEARKSAEMIKYNFKIQGNNLILDNYLLTGTDAKYHKQRVEIFLYLPEGTYLQPDSSLRDYDMSDDEFFDQWSDNNSYIYKVGRDRVECINCIDGEDGSYMDIPEIPDPVVPGPEGEIPEPATGPGDESETTARAAAALSKTVNATVRAQMDEARKAIEESQREVERMNRQLEQDERKREEEIRRSRNN